MRAGIVVPVVAALALLAGACADGLPTAPTGDIASPQATSAAGSESGFLIQANSAKGNATRDLTDLSARGWFCQNVPGLGVHCFAPGVFSSLASVSVLVFDTDDATHENAPFLGTELLIRADLYAGQPCPPEGGGEYELLPASESPFPVDYRACHHYSD